MDNPQVLQANHRQLEDYFQAMVNRLRESYPPVDQARLRQAFDFMCKAHESQQRKSGEPFAVHPAATALIVAQMNLDPDSVIGALLHDVLEDTNHERAEIVAHFGEDIAKIVDGVTKLTNIFFISKEAEQIENLRKMFLAMAHDTRVIMIKIADRLHNMRTLGYHTEAKRREKSLETMQIYAPLAHRLGMQTIKCELEDLSLKNLDPIAYKEITQALSDQESWRSDFLGKIKETIAEHLSAVEIEAKIEGRTKHIYSIYNKMYSQKKTWFDIHDLYAVRVIVESKAECYNALGIIHEIFNPMPGKFKDYISTPKPNMYESIHTIVVSRKGQPFEVQIRTWEMHKRAEYGIAAHWQYKGKVTKHDEKLNEKLESVCELLGTRHNTDLDDFISTLKVDMFDGKVFVFTPKGDVINLPQGSNVVDFAYAIHSNVGNTMTGAQVNNRIVSFEHIPQNGDIVNIITTKGHKPSRDLQKIAKTSEAKSKLRRYFREGDREENIEHGKASFEAELRRIGITLSTVTRQEVLEPSLRKMGFDSIDDMYATIGFGGITSLRAINRFRDELVRISRQKESNDETDPGFFIRKRHAPQKSISGVIVDGIENCLVKFSNCCTPIPGDSIIGFITKGHGISIHKEGCKSAISMRRDGEDDRWINVRWANNNHDKYSADIMISALDRRGLLQDVMSALNSDKLSILSVTAQTDGSGGALMQITAEVSDTDHLDSMRKKLSGVDGVSAVYRK
ncbi:MAG: bifunctional (p)ppGpp synthetase/guanosine-3',5'-bis(diphosphate) 3'-pyrophosphohydrolase [Oscillospiraceae bacterium]|nr:bifunctional (p)ppGpp synthetase/guanosine-3',5'-bis(diphosphate) 3'-pyrophosphohydrolase [Oscillospiraceae bacterium]